MRRILAMTLVAALLLFSGCGTVDNMTGVGQAKALQKTGVAASAVIVRISDTGMTVNDDPVAWLDLEVRPENRPPFPARTKCLIPRLDVPQFQPGKTIPVRYDPRDLSRVAVDVYPYD